MTDARGNDTVFEYDIPGRLTRTYYADNPANAFIINIYDAADRVMTQTDANGNDWQLYISGYRSEEESPLGNSQVTYYNAAEKAIRRIDPLENITLLEYDGHHRLVKKTMPEGNYTEYEYDDHHNPITITEYPKTGSAETPLQATFTYDTAFNKILTATDPLERTTTLTYDSYANLTLVTQPTVDGQAPEIGMTYNNRGQVLTHTDPEGRTTAYAYDTTTGDLLSVTVDNGGLDLVTRFTYNDVGDIETLTDPEGNISTYKVNNNRLVEKETGPAPFNYVKEFDYDELNRLIETRFETGDTSNPWQTGTVTYNAMGKKHIVTDPEGDRATYSYDIAYRLSQVTNAENQTTEYVYDDAGQIFQVIDAKGNITREITYTANGLTETQTDANGNTTRYLYDDFDRPAQTTYPDSSYEAYTWDDTGNLTSRLTRAGQTITFVYDDLNRMVSKILPDAGTIAYTYDLSGLQIDVTDSLGTITHVYDNALRPASVIYPDGKTVGYQYDGNSNRTRLTYPDNAYVTYAYDNLNRVTGIYQNGTTLLAQYDYDALSRRTTLTYGNGNTSTYGYQLDNDLASLALTHAAGTATYTFTTNNIGIRTQTDVDDYRFVYRPASAVSTAYTPNSLNQYTTVGSTSPAYDNNGNLISDGTNTYTYDAENRLLTAVTPDHTANYTYDPMGRRIEKEVDGTTITQYLHDNDQVIVEYNGSGTELRRYIYGPGIDEPVCMITASSTYYYHFDGLGSVTALTDETGALQEIYAYSVFGKPNGASSLGNPYLYTGREYDPETGLYYYRARYYNPTIGRFMQTDPIGYDDGMNVYIYASNNPVMFIDPLGLCTSSGNKAKQISNYVNWYFDRSGLTEYLTNTNKSNDVNAGITLSLLTTDYDAFFNTKGHSSSLLGASVDFTVGDPGAAEVGLGHKNLGIGVNLDNGGVVGGTAHIGLSFPPSAGYGSVSNRE